MWNQKLVDNLVDSWVDKFGDMDLQDFTSEELHKLCDQTRTDFECHYKIVQKDGTHRKCKMLAKSYGLCGKHLELDADENKMDHFKKRRIKTPRKQCAHIITKRNSDNTEQCPRHAYMSENYCTTHLKGHEKDKDINIYVNIVSPSMNPPKRYVAYSDMPPVAELERLPHAKFCDLWKRSGFIPLSYVTHAMSQSVTVRNSVIAFTTHLYIDEIPLTTVNDGDSQLDISALTRICNTLRKVFNIEISDTALTSLIKNCCEYTSQSDDMDIILKWFYQKINSSSHTKLLTQVLLLASSQGNTKFVRKLLNLGADIKGFDHGYGSPLIVSTLTGQKNTMNFIYDLTQDATVFQEFMSIIKSALIMLIETGDKSRMFKFLFNKVVKQIDVQEIPDVDSLKELAKTNHHDSIVRFLTSKLSQSNHILQ